MIFIKKVIIHKNAIIFSNPFTTLSKKVLISMMGLNAAINKSTCYAKASNVNTVPPAYFKHY